MSKFIHKRILILMSIFIFCITLMGSCCAISSESNLSYQGIDVSDWQGYIDYSKVKTSGIEVVFIKASQGIDWKDPYFEINYTNAKANGLKVGFYHFLTAINEDEARQEARFFSSVISGKQVDCRLVMDYEVFQGADVDTINQISLTFLKTVESLTGKQMMIYSDLYNASNIFREELSNRYPLWLAYYGDRNLLENINTNWNNYIGLQYNDKAIVMRNTRLC